MIGRQPRRARANWALLSALLFAACGGGDSLEGSLSQDVSLTFDQVQIQQSSNEVAVLYMEAITGGSGSNVVFELTVDTTGLDLTKSISIDLTEMVNGAERGQCQRLVAGDSRSTFPAITRGSLNLSQATTSGVNVSGSFNVLFINDGMSSLGEGETVFGDFSATVVAAQ